jgi:hypothetical protein
MPDFGIISSAYAINSFTDTAGTGSSGGGYALLIILASAITYGFGWAAYKKWRRRQNPEADQTYPPKP